MAQLPGLAVQRLMADGYGFGAEGDWKTAALVRAMKVMASGLRAARRSWKTTPITSTRRDRRSWAPTCWRSARRSRTGSRPWRCIRWASAARTIPARLVFSAAKGAALNATIIDMGTRFRMVVNEVDVVAPDAPLPKLPVARALWVPAPEPEGRRGRLDPCRRGAPLGLQLGRDRAAPGGLRRHGRDRVPPDRLGRPTLPQFRKELRWNAAYWHLAGGV